MRWISSKIAVGSSEAEGTINDRLSKEGRDSLLHRPDGSLQDTRFPAALLSVRCASGCESGYFLPTERGSREVGIFEDGSRFPPKGIVSHKDESVSTWRI